MFVAPNCCPDCQTKLILSDTGVDLICPNQHSCSSQISAKLSYYCQRGVANIVGLSEKSVAKFIKLGYLDDISDLYNLPYKDISDLDSFGKKSIENMANSIESSRVIPDYKFLAGLGIDGLGIEISKLICQML